MTRRSPQQNAVQTLVKPLPNRLPLPVELNLPPLTLDTARLLLEQELPIQEVVPHSSRNEQLHLLSIVPLLLHAVHPPVLPLSPDPPSVRELVKEEKMKRREERMVEEKRRVHHLESRDLLRRRTS